MVRAAVASNIPPLALIFEDESRHRKYTKWDYRLIKAVYAMEHYEVNGYPVWVEESPDVTFKAKKKTIRSKAAVEKLERSLTRGGKETAPGTIVYPTVEIKSGGSWPRRADWLERKAKAKEAPDAGPEAGRASDDKMAEMRRLSEERARVKRIRAERENGTI